MVSGSAYVLRCQGVVGLCPTSISCRGLDFSRRLGQHQENAVMRWLLFALVLVLAACGGADDSVPESMRRTRRALPMQALHPPEGDRRRRFLVVRPMSSPPPPAHSVAQSCCRLKRGTIMGASRVLTRWCSFGWPSEAESGSTMEPLMNLKGRETHSPGQARLRISSPVTKRRCRSL